jgi:3-hydroxybutyryl-CoA dehydrogenase
MPGVVDVQDVLVLGAGTMGQGIAQVAARAGYSTRLFDIAPGAAERALIRIADSLQRAVDKGRLGREDHSRGSRWRPTSTPRPHSPT